MALDENALKLTITVDTTGLASKMDEAGAVVKKSTQKISEATAEASSGMSVMRERFAEARVEGGVLEGSVAGMTHGIEHLAASSRVVGAAISGLFPVFAMLGAIEIISEVEDKLQKVKNAVAIETIEWDRANATIREHSSALTIENLKLEDQLAKLESRPEPNRLAIALREADAEAEKLFGSLAKDVDEQLKLLENKGVGVFDALISGTASTSEITEKMRAPLLQLETALEKQRTIQAETSDAVTGKVSADAKKQAEDRRAAAAAAVETARKAASDILTTLEDQEAAAKQSNIETETGTGALAKAIPLHHTIAAATERVNRSYAAQDAMLAGLHTALTEIGRDETQNAENDPLRRKVALAQNAREAVEEEARAHEEITKAVELTGKMARADLEESKKEGKESHDLAMAGIKGEELVENERAKGVEANLARELAAHKITVQQETDALEAAARKKSDLKLGELGAEKSVELDPSKALTIQKQIEAEKIRIENEVAKIHDDGNKKIAAEDLKLMQERATADEQAANKQLATANRLDEEKLRAHQETLGHWAAQEAAAIDGWYAQQLAVYNRQLAFMKSHNLTETAEYQKLIAKKEALDQEYAAKHQQLDEIIATKQKALLDKMTGNFNTSLMAWMSGQKRASLAFAEMFDSMLNEGAMALIKLGEQFLINELLQKSSVARELVAFLTGTATKTATAKAAQLAMVTGEAGAGSAAAYASVMESVPFPVNVALAPAIAAETFASIMGFGAFEKGGMVAQTGMAYLHEKEMVLPSSIAQPLAAAAESGSVGGGHTLNVNMGNISAIDAHGVDKVLMKRSREMVKHVDRLLRYSGR